MTQQAENTSGVDNACSEDELGDDFESVGDQHRAATQHFATAGHHHLAAAAADDEGDCDTADRHACLAYCLWPDGVQHAESAVMDSESHGDVIASGL